MALLNILHYPDERLHTVATAIDTFDEALQQRIEDMFETMYEAPGIGLAATQVNVHQRVVVIDVSEDKSGLLALINPEIISRSGEQVCEEGCLSVPGIYDKVARAEQVRVRALNPRGETIEFDADGLLAVCVQHELDHLDGKVFVEYLSQLKQTRIKGKLAKKARITA